MDNSKVDILPHDFFDMAGKAFINYLDGMFLPFQRLINQKFPIYIANTGDEVFLNNMQASSKKKAEELYSMIPRMVLDVKGFSMLSDQLTANTELGRYSVLNAENFTTKKKANVKRIPLDWTFSCEIVFNNIIEFFKFTEIYFTTSHNNHFFKFYYAGVEYSASFAIPEDVDSEANLGLQFDSEKRRRILPLTFVVQLQYPSFDVYRNGQIYNESERMNKIIHNMHVDDESPAGIVSTIEVTKSSNL